MQLRRRQLPLFLSILAALFLFGAGAFADDWKLTGTGIRVKTVVLVDVNVYQISHFIKGEVGEKSKKGVIDADIDKKFEWKMKRDVDHEKVVQTLRDAFAMNGYSDAGKINKFLGAFSAELKENAKISIVYDAAKKATTVSVGGGGSATVEGVDFMKGVWAIWFGKIDQPKLGDALISKL
ncbi:chalcone isomerase family protein [Polyangium sp. 6x1]|uniref:chalcone isomerase family protein n=1 Tax=Polyangium sp. 6x1 TaxID=3042689 RepID=UPI002482DEC7|nr:chalcone isomerase family protein [Polyangium sp. 6x1]MDI1448872.1 chalcone isomerase family protein [Polyangium sp. 6x1]